MVIAVSLRLRERHGRWPLLKDARKSTAMMLDESRLCLCDTGYAETHWKQWTAVRASNKR
jgi:hypothetical protein